MKRITFLTMLAFCAGPGFAQDCAKYADACPGGALKNSPFVQASLSENLPPAPPAAKGKRAVLREEVPPAVAAFSSAAPTAAAAPVPDGKAGMSSPLWLLFMGAVLAALYFYLRAGRRRGRKR